MLCAVEITAVIEVPLLMCYYVALNIRMIVINLQDEMLYVRQFVSGPFSRAHLCLLCMYA